MKNFNGFPLRTRLYKVGVLVGASLLWGGLLFFTDLVFPQVKILGQSVVTIEVGATYQELGALGTWEGRKLKVQPKGNVDTEAVGTFTLTYQVKEGLFKKAARRRIRVVDRQAPVIELTDGPNVYLCPHREYQEPGYRAKDNVDGDLTKKIRVVKEKNQFRYLVKDSSGNQGMALRKIIREDKEAPVVTLRGPLEMTLTQGSTYTEPGAEATDLFDRDIASKVVIKGTVDSGTPGTYTLTYEATDCSGNQGTAVRKIQVNPRIQVSSDSVIYLTFDDGPSSITSGVLDILRDEGIKATFFIEGVYMEDYAYLWKRMIAEGHTIGLHCDTHNYSVVYASTEAYFRDLYSVQSKVRSVTGVNSFILRFPGGSSNGVSKKYTPGIMSTLVKEVANRGFHYFDWNVASADTMKLSSGEIKANVLGGLRSSGGNVVLMHDRNGNETTMLALRGIIQEARSRGYTFSKITMETPEVHHHVSN